MRQELEKQIIQILKQNPPDLTSNYLINMRAVLLIVKLFEGIVDELVIEREEMREDHIKGDLPYYD